jgi:hypothetical protein
LAILISSNGYAICAQRFIFIEFNWFYDDDTCCGLMLVVVEKWQYSAVNGWHRADFAILKGQSQGCLNFSGSLVEHKHYISPWRD